MSREDWPTLKEMLDSGKRVVVFMDKGAEDGSVNYILPQFSMVMHLFFSFSFLPFLTSLQFIYFS